APDTPPLSLRDALPISGRGLLRHTGAVGRTRRVHGLGLARVTHRAAEQERLAGRAEQDPFTINTRRGCHLDHPAWLRASMSGRRSEEHTSELQSRENLV